MKRNDRGGIEVSVKITSAEEEYSQFEKELKWPNE